MVLEYRPRCYSFIPNSAKTYDTGILQNTWHMNIHTSDVVCKTLCECDCCTHGVFFPYPCCSWATTRLVLPKKKVMIEDSNPWMLKPRFWIWRFLMWDLCSSSIPPFPWWVMGSSNCNGIYHLDKGKPDLATVTDAEGTKPSFKSQTHGSEQVWWKQQKILILFVRVPFIAIIVLRKC